MAIRGEVAKPRGFAAFKGKFFWSRMQSEWWCPWLPGVTLHVFQTGRSGRWKWGVKKGGGLVYSPGSFADHAAALGDLARELGIEPGGSGNER
jgi:hypothetical protein